MSKCALPLLSLCESIYVLGLIPIFIYESVLHDLFGLNKIFPFLPLMLISLYCSVGIIYCWINYYVYFLKKNPEDNKRKLKKVS